jgi:transcriptional regulator with XRE-family HTH domain
MGVLISVSEKSELISRLKTKKKSRDSYTRALLNVLIPAQLRSLRFRNKLTQKALAKEAEMKQSRISTMERPGASQFNVETLIRLASAFKVGLKVEFVSFSEMLKWENGFNADAFNPPTIEADIEFQQGTVNQAVDDNLPSKTIDLDAIVASTQAGYTFIGLLPTESYLASSGLLGTQKQKEPDEQVAYHCSDAVHVDKCFTIQ